MRIRMRMRYFVLCSLLTTVTKLTVEFIKHVAAHFAAFIAPFLLVLTILCFQDTVLAFLFCFFFKKSDEKYEKETCKPYYKFLYQSY